MIGYRNNIKRILRLCLVLLALLAFFPECAPPVVPGELKDIEISFYPDREIIFYDSFGLFSTTVVIPSLDATVNAFNIVLRFDDSKVKFESVSGSHCLPYATVYTDAVRIKATGAGIESGEYVKLFTVTWKAITTGFTDISLEVDKMTTDTGEPLNMKLYSDTIRIVKEMGVLSFSGNPYIEMNADFTQTLTFSSLDKNVKEYDINIYYDPGKVILNVNAGNQGISAGAEGFFDTVTPGDGVINIKGVRPADSGAGGNGEFLITSWSAVESGRTTVSLEVNKLVVTDDIFIKPELRSVNLSLYSDNNRPAVDVRMKPAAIATNVNSAFSTSVVLNIDSYVLAAYGIDILYDSAVIALDKSQANGAGIAAGQDGFLTVVNSLVPGIISTAGFDLKGKAPNPELELLKIYWKALAVSAYSEIVLDVKILSDIRSRIIDRINKFDSVVTVNP